MEATVAHAWRLRWMSETSTGEASFGPGAHVLGSAPDADLRLPDLTVSRHHARLTCSDDGVTIEDLGSTNGTAVNGMPIDGPVLVTGKASLKVGRVKVDLIPKTRSSAPQPWAFSGKPARRSLSDRARSWSGAASTRTTSSW